MKRKLKCAATLVLAIPLSPCAFAEEGEQELAEVRVVATPESRGESVIDRSTMDALNAGNGDITSMLRVLPNVQFDNNQLHTGRQGEIAPADISINGSKFYENLYQLDGMSLNNNLDPAGNNPVSITEPNSASQGLAIDTSLLCKITLRDSNVGAEFGHFTGGVVSADTCAPTRDFGGRVSYQTTRSAWTHYKFSSAAQEATYDSSTSYLAQPSFDKRTWRVALQGRPSSTLGLIGSIVREESFIPLRGYNANSFNPNTPDLNKEQTRRNDNFFVRAFWNPSSDTDADLSLSYAPGTARYFIVNTKNSDMDIESGGYGINAGLVRRLDSLTASTRLTLSSMESSRRQAASALRVWRYSAEKNWGAVNGLSQEGGYGDLDQVQKDLNWTFKGEWKPIHFFGLEHSFTAGGEIDRQEQLYDRKTRFDQYNAASGLSTTCNLTGGGVDTENCSRAQPNNTANPAQGQYFTTRIVYLAGNFTVTDNSAGLYVQDEMKLDRLRVRLGLRHDRSSLIPSTLAPRFAVFYDIFGDGEAQLEFGANRYYGRNFMRYYTYGQRLLLQGTQTRTIVGTAAATTSINDWGPLVMSATGLGWNVVNGLKAPHDDELVLAGSLKGYGFLWGIKRVDRRTRDEVVLTLRSAANRWYDNTGHSESDTWSLTMESLRPLEWKGSHTRILASVDRTRVYTSHADYTDVLNNVTNDLDKTVLYDGQPIKWVDRPANNYARPWAARVLFNTEIPSARLTLGNFISWRDSYQKFVNIGNVNYNGVVMANWQRRDFGRALTWDTNVTWAIPVRGKQEVAVTLSVDNVLDRTNTIENSGTTDMVYEKGRQFWLDLAYKF